MNSQEKLQAIRQRFGNTVPSCLRYVLGQRSFGRLTPDDYKDLHKTFYPTRGIYWGDVTLEQREMFGEAVGDTIPRVLNTIVVIRNAQHLVLWVMVRQEHRRLLSVGEHDDPRYLDFEPHHALADNDLTPTL